MRCICMPAMAASWFSRGTAGVGAGVAARRRRRRPLRRPNWSRSVSVSDLADERLRILVGQPLREVEA